jgi:hypothetical protein
MDHQAAKKFKFVQTSQSDLQKREFLSDWPQKVAKFALRWQIIQVCHNPKSLCIHPVSLTCPALSSLTFLIGFVYHQALSVW